jgi:hypothetical protein
LCTRAANVVACCLKVDIDHIYMACIMCTCRNMKSYGCQRGDLEGDEGARIIHVEEAHLFSCRLSIAGWSTLSQPARRSCLSMLRCTRNSWWNQARTGRRGSRGRQSRTLPVWCTCLQAIRRCTLSETWKKIPAHSCRVHSLYIMRA